MIADQEPMVEEVTIEGVVCAVIVRRDFNRPGVHFFTPGSFSQQLAFMSHPTGHRIAAHLHRDVQRDVIRTQEVLVIRKGRLRVDFYDRRQERVDSRTMEAGDVILLASGGHGFEVLEDCEMIEVKQGPYLGDQDKMLLARPVRE
jgi:mannose-6-phosphate isomerase-like protein (cupin superfamily)